MKRKKIVHIVEAFGGGVFSFLVDLVNATSEEFEITIAYGKRNQTPEKFECCFNKNVNFVEIKNFDRSINLKKDLKAFLEIKTLIKKIKPDIIHLHSSKAGFLGRFATNDRKVKMLYNPHGFSFLMKDASKIKRLFYWLIEKVSAIRNCKIVGCSYGEYQEALKLRKDSICINNGVNIEKIDEETKDFPQYHLDINNLKICTSGRIGYQKNPELFNEIAESFSNLQFTWIGDGELRDKLKSSNIQVTGWKSREEVLKIVNENDIFILTSLWEGLPISLLEAMYLKKVCVVTDCIGNRDVIKNDENGFIINEEKYKEVIKNITLEKYKSVSNKAKEDVVNEFNTSRMANEYIEKYRG